jgi:hypothetical protein
MSRLLRILGFGSALVAVLVLVILALVLARFEVIAHRRPPAPMTLRAAQIGAEDAQLRQMGLIVGDGHFLTEHPFAPPWTSHSLLLPSNWSTGPSLIQLLLGPPRVRANLLFADLDVLQPVMERAYAGWDTAAARGWNWNQWFANWRKMLAAQGSAEISFNQAFAPMDALIAFQRDNHTQIPLRRTSTIDRSQTAVLAGAASAPCLEIRAGGRIFPIAVNDPAQQVRAAKLWTSRANAFTDADYIAMPSSYGTPQAVHCGGDWISLQPIESSGTSGIVRLLRDALRPPRPRIERLGDGIVYVRLPTFDAENYAGVSRTSWPRHQPGDRVLIVDLRDNGGGDSAYGRDVLQGWIDESRMVNLHQIGTQITSSCLFGPLNWSYPDQGSRLPVVKRRSLQGLLDRMNQPNPPGCPRTVDTTPVRWTYLQHRFTPKPDDLRIVVLVNSGCASDCEWMTVALASLPETIVAGTNTFGNGEFIQPRYSVLPHTGLAYRMAQGRWNIYGDNRSVDGYGLDVDVVLPEVNEMGAGQLRELADAVTGQMGEVRYTHEDQYRNRRPADGASATPFRGAHQTRDRGACARAAGGTGAIQRDSALPRQRHLGR